MYIYIAICYLHNSSCIYVHMSAYCVRMFRVTTGGLSHPLARPPSSAGSTRTSSPTSPPIRPYSSTIQHPPLSARPHPIRVVPLKPCLGMRCRICSRCQVTRSASPAHWLDGGWRWLPLRNCVDNH